MHQTQPTSQHPYPGKSRYSASESWISSHETRSFFASRCLPHERSASVYSGWLWLVFLERVAKILTKLVRTTYSWIADYGGSALDFFSSFFFKKDSIRIFFLHQSLPSLEIVHCPTYNEYLFIISLPSIPEKEDRSTPPRENNTTKHLPLVLINTSHLPVQQTLFI